MGQLGSLFDGFERIRSFFRRTIGERRVGISCSVELNEPSSDCKCGPNLLFGWVNEEADIDVYGLKAFDCIGDRLLIAGAVQTAWGCNFPRKFGNESHLIRYDVEGNSQHFFGSRHFDVQLRLDGFAKNLDVAMLNMPAIPA